MCELAYLYPNAEGIQKEALNQCARELLLAQSSDWLIMQKRELKTILVVLPNYMNKLRQTKLMLPF